MSFTKNIMNSFSGRIHIAYMLTLCLMAWILPVAPAMAASNVHLVKDINPGTAWSQPTSLSAIGTNLFFFAKDGVNGFELWKSDGTAAGTVLVKDIQPGSGPFATVNQPLVNINGTAFFFDNDLVNGFELWKSDGTAVGTMLVKDITPGATGTPLDGLVNVNGTLFFRANTDLWSSDGTAAGTVLVSSAAFFPTQLTNVNGVLFCVANGGKLWKSNGGGAGTVQVKNINGGAAGIKNMTNVNGILFFTADDGINGVELWKSNGTAAGTVMVKNINPVVPNPGAGLFGNSSPGSLTNVNGTLFFSADDGVNGRELWKSDGTAAGTVMVKDIQPGTGGSGFGIIEPFLNVNGTLFFPASDGIHGVELWESDGTAAGTVMVKDITTFGAGDSNPGRLATANGSVFFNTNINGGGGGFLYESDGTAAGTHIVTDNNGVSSGTVGSLTNVNGVLFGAGFAVPDVGMELLAVKLSIPPSISLALNPGPFNTNSMMTLTATTVAGNPATNADVYVALQLPDGTLLVMQPDGSFSTALTPLLANIPIPAFTGPIFNFTFSGAEPVGNYTWFAALTTPGTLQVIGTLAVAPFSFVP